MRKGASFEWDEQCQNAFEASIGTLLARRNEEGKEVACYYLSCTLVGAETNHPDLVKYVHNHPALLGSLGKWVVLMMEFDIKYTPQRP